MAASHTLSLRPLNRATLARQMLLAREKISPVAAVERLIALQAQVPRPPFVGLWTRLADFTRDDLLRLLHKRNLVRGPSLRGTLHLMSAKDFAGLRGAIQPALRRGLLVVRDRAKGLDIPKLVAEGRTFFREPAPFDDIRGHFKKKDPKGDERAQAYAVRLHVPLVMVPTDDPWAFPAAADFVLADTWLGRPVSADDVPPHQLVKRYLAAFGPATPADAQVWSGLQRLREVFEELRPRLVTFRDEKKRELFDLPGAPRPDEDAPAPVRFLPEFDNLLLSHDDRTRVIADAHRSRVISKNLQVRATFLVDGFVAGAWKVERRKAAATLVLEPFGKLAKPALAELEEEGDALLRFVEEDATARGVKVAK